MINVMGQGQMSDQSGPSWDLVINASSDKVAVARYVSLIT